MSGAISDHLADRVTGSVGMLLAGSYVAYARGIEDSLLADAVGASGVPVAVGAVLFAASLMLFLKSWHKSKVAVSANERDAGDPEQVQLPSNSDANPHLKAAGLLVILALYVLLLPLLGYAVSIGLLVGSAAWFGGARRPQSLLLSVLLAGPMLWLMFDWALGIRLPVSSLLQALSR